MDDLEVWTGSGIVVELPELCKSDGAILISIILVEDVFDALVFRRAG